MQIETKDEKKYKRVHEEVLKRVDKYENDNQPQVGEIFIIVLSSQIKDCISLNDDVNNYLTNKSR